MQRLHAGQFLEWISVQALAEAKLMGLVEVGGGSLAMAAGFTTSENKLHELKAFIAEFTQTISII
ncbi:MAG UNVERIFIED_CONTAM: hypothetical protein LVQ98_06095 [Rickettsiaceae bacterium]